MDRFRLMPSYRYYDTEGASPLTLPESVGKSLRDYKIYGSTDGVGDESKNLFDITWVTENANEAYIELDGETLVLKSYACQTGMTPERFLELTGLSEGDTVTTSHTKEAVSGETNTISGRILFYLQGSSSSGFILTANGNKRSSVIPENFNSENYQPMMIYGCKEADENGSQIMNISDLMITTDSEAEYEPYYEGYKIPVTVNEETYSIYLDEPLAEGEYIDFINQKAVRSAGEETVSLPTIKTHKGTNIITVGTEVEPSDIKVQYYK